LINHGGSQGKLNNEFERIYNMSKDKDVSMTKFDFHKEIGMKYENVNNLIRKIDDAIQEYGYFYSKEGEVIDLQKGVLRTNCMDNLDRTNVVQMSLAKYILKIQLDRENIVDKNNFDRQLNLILNHIWANNGDQIAIQYAGTGALKSDFTRYGKRSFKGLIDDGINSIKRYFLNNFTDGKKEDSLNLFVGNYIVSKDKSPFTSNGPLFSRSLAILSILALLYSSYSIFTKEFKTFNFILYILYIAMFYKFITTIGKNVVDKPRLKISSRSTKI